MFRINKLIRSVLFTPADRKTALEKAFASQTSDCVIFDLEDAVAGTISSKELGRQNIKDLLTRRKGYVLEYNPSIVIRINCPERSAFGKSDLEFLKDNARNIDAVLVPKAECTQSVKKIADYLKMPIWCMIETPKGVQNVDSLAAMHEVECLVFGSNDLTKDLKATISPITRHPLLYSMSRTIVAARAENKLVVDGVHMDLGDGSELGLEQVCLQGKELGFDGKSLIHPKQVDVANRVFSPSETEVSLAARVIKAYGEAMSAGKGVCLLDGKLIEQLHVDAAHELIDRFKAIQRRSVS